MQGNKSKGGYVALFSLSLVLLLLFLCRDLLLRFLVRKRHSYSNSWQDKRSSASCGLCNEWHLCHVGVVSWKPQLLFFFTIRHRRPCRPSRSIRSKARGEQCASARIWSRGRGSWLAFVLLPHPLPPLPLPRHCLRLRKERS